MATGANQLPTVTILVVDDDEVDRRAIARALRRHALDHPVRTASGAEEALAILRGSPGFEPLPWPYIVLLDLNMPRMNGFEFLDEIRADRELRGTVVFMLTTSDAERDKLEAYQHNVAGYLLKSRSGREVLDLVSMIEKFLLTARFPKAPGADE